MNITQQEYQEFFNKYKKVEQHIKHSTMQIPTNLDVLAFILVMEKEDPTKLIELMKEMKE